ncbi:MAG: toxic anion resistance protein [Planctomycetes bacterium]|nr:toxic anion resistance protein [Planctomycetota bacterium]
MLMPTKVNEQPMLQVPDVTGLKKELMTPVAGELSLKDADPALVNMADQFVTTVMACNPDTDQTGHDTITNSVELMGSATQRQAGQKSAMLREPIKKLAEKGKDGGDVSNALVSLKLKVEELDPGRFDFEAGWFSRLFTRVPFFGKPIKKYFTKYETSQVVIDAIIRALEIGAEQLERDNMILANDQGVMRALTLQLMKNIVLGMIIDQKLSEALGKLSENDDPRHRFIAEELLFPLRQRIQDLQQQLAVNQQGVLAIEIIIRNNKELIKGVDRSINVTVSALNVAITVALALANQKIVLDKIDAIRTTTNKLIGDTARRLKTQGVAIQKQAVDTAVGMKELEAAFTDIHAAMADISDFKMKALPQMASQILKLDQLTTDAEERIRDMEAGNAAAKSIKLDAGLIGQTGNA